MISKNFWCYIICPSAVDMHLTYVVGFQVLRACIFISSGSGTSTGSRVRLPEFKSRLPTN